MILSFLITAISILILIIGSVSIKKSWSKPQAWRDKARMASTATFLLASIFSAFSTEIFSDFIIQKDLPTVYLLGTVPILAFSCFLISCTSASFMLWGNREQDTMAIIILATLVISMALIGWYLPEPFYNPATNLTIMITCGAVSGCILGRIFVRTRDRYAREESS